MILAKIKWIFFDIGSTLVDESVAYHNRIERTIGIFFDIGSTLVDESVAIFSDS